MAAKISLPIVEDRRPLRNRSSRRRHRFVAMLVVVALAFFGLYNFGPATSSTYASRLADYGYAAASYCNHGGVYGHHQEDGHSSAYSTSSTAATTSNNARDLVPLEAHIMSKCPDAKDCLKELVLPAMMHVSPKVNFTLSYIGVPTENDGVDCMHGPAECMGNIIELCAAELYPDPKIYLGFTMCVTREYKLIPQRELVEDCALEHGIDFQALNECAARDDGAHGTALLRSSVQRTSAAGVKKSCTVRLNEEVYCIRDSGKWSDCPTGAGVNDLVIAVEKLYRGGMSLSS